MAHSDTARDGAAHSDAACKGAAAIAMMHMTVLPIVQDRRLGRRVEVMCLSAGES